MGCINDCWNQTDNEGGYSCPQCWRTFIVKPELNRNAVFAELIENVKEVTTNGGTSQSYAGPADVLCDVCPGRKRKASKTCLTCMVSYCETHMLPHREFPAYKRHKVEKEAGNLEEKLCAKHHRVLEIFCRTNKSCICLLCAATEHKYHETVTAEEERAGRQNHLQYTKHGVEKKIEKKEKKLEEIK
uniref:B box-type domain-containing protein n=1 Tax=Erpetoichthys calabaricus TaxID=27687 RepID=A0A8C4TNC9_ERPCA